MNIKPFLCTIIVLAGFTACVVDYNLSDSFINEPDYIVINSLLSPTQPVKIDFYQTMKTDSGYTCIPLTGVRVLLKENDQILYDAVCEDSVLELPYYPKTGQNYSLEAFAPGKGSVSANTSIPVPATCDSAYIYDGDPYDWMDDYLHFSSFQIDMQGQASLWITFYYIYDEGIKVQFDEIYTSHPLIDKFNRLTGPMGVLNPYIGSLYHEVFLRIKNTNLPLFDHLYCEPFLTHPVNIESLDWDASPVQFQFKLIMASKEYDRYCKSLYQQKSMVAYDDEISFIFYQPRQVYSNITGGLGIFAGMSETDYFFDITSEESNYSHE